MASEFKLSIVAPDRSVLDEPVHSVIAPGTEGYFGVLAGHVPMITSLKAGFLEYTDLNNQRHYVAVSGGFAEVLPNKVSIVADTAERATEIDVSRAEAALERARQALQAHDSSLTSEQAVAEIEKAMNRINVAQKR